MANTAASVPLPLPVDGVTLVRLQGKACITCGTTTGPLLPAGHVETTSCGAILPWAVVACPVHLGERL